MRNTGNDAKDIFLAGHEEIIHGQMVTTETLRLFIALHSWLPYLDQLFLSTL